MYPIVFDPGVLIETYERLRELASEDHLVIPGHDPNVMTSFPPALPNLTGIAVRLSIDGGLTPTGLDGSRLPIGISDK